MENLRRKPKNEPDKLFKYLNSYIEHNEDLDELEMAHTYGVITAWDDAENIVDLAQQSTDQGATLSFGKLAGSDHHCAAEWVIVNGVVRRYGYSL